MVKLTKTQWLLRPTMLALSLALTACATHPKYQAPQQIGTAVALPAQFQVADPLHSWWRSFADPQLSQLIDTALAQNTTVQAALANAQKAESLWRDAKLNGTPKLQGSVGAQRSKAGAAATGITEQYRGGVDLSWDLDLNGKLQQAALAQSAASEVAHYDWLQAQLALVAQVASSYGDWQGSQLRLQVAKDNLTNLQQSRDLILLQQQAGVTSELELQRMTAQLYAMEATIPQLALQQRQAQLQLEALLGLKLNSLKLTTVTLPKLTQPLALADVTAALQYRPDLASAERQLASSHAVLGMNKADLYPTLSLTGFLGFISLGSINTGAEQQAWSVAPTLSWQGANWASLQSRINAAAAGERQALALFQQQVFDALAQMQYSLDSYNASRRQQLLQQQQLQASSAAYRLSKLQYQAGQTAFLELLDAERELLAAREQAAVLELNNYQRLVQIYRSFAGSLSFS